MRHYIAYLAAVLIAFTISLAAVAAFYLKTNIEADAVPSPAERYSNRINQTISEIEAENKGFDELLNLKDGDVVTVQEYIDQKFLCHDVTAWQPGICTTVLTGIEPQKKSLVIRLATCGANGKSNCIVWKPENLCENDELCSDRIRIYDNNSKFIELVERIGKNSFTSKNVKLKFTGRVSINNGKARLSGPIEKIEFAESQ